MSGALVHAYHASEGEEDGDVQRRTMLRTLTGIALSASSPLIALEALRQGLSRAVDADHDEWQAIAADYANAFYTTPHSALLDQLTADLGLLQQLMTAHPDNRDLARAGAQISAVLALTLAASGQRLLARRWWNTATLAADRSGDPEVRVLIRSQDAVIGLYDGRSPAQVIALADEALALAEDRAFVGTAGALAGRAQALAELGRTEEAVAAVRTVEKVSARLPAAVVANTESLCGWPEHRIWHTQSYVYTRVGRTTEAIAAQDQAIPLYPDSQARLRTQVQMHRASCLIQDGHVGDGLRYAADALDQLPAEQANEVLYAMVRQVAATVPHAERRRPELGELRDRIPALPAPE